MYYLLYSLDTILPGWNPQFDDMKEETVEAYLMHEFSGLWISHWCGRFCVHVSKYMSLSLHLKSLWKWGALIDSIVVLVLFVFCYIDSPLGCYPFIQ